MKLIIDIPDKIVTAIQNGQDYRYDIHTAIAQGKPCDTSDDLISREWLKDAFDNLCCHNCKICRNFRNEDSFYKCALIENAPTIKTFTLADIEDQYRKGLEKGLSEWETERPQGEWKITGAYPHKVYCDKCYKTYAQENWEVWKDGSLPRNFCPNCGAAMQKGGKEE